MWAMEIAGSRVAAAEPETIAGIAVIARHRRNRKNQILPLIHADDRRSKKKQHLAISNWQLEHRKPILLHKAPGLKPYILKRPYAALKRPLFHQ